MEIRTGGKRNIRLPETDGRQRVVLKDINGDVVSYIKTGKNGGRITGVVPDVVFAELEEVPLRPVNMGALNIAKILDLTDEMNLVLEKQNAIRQAFSAVLDFKAEIEDKFIKNKEQTDIALSELAEVARNTGIINDERYEEIKAVDLSQSVDIEKIYSICRDLSEKSSSIENDILNITNVLASHEHEKQTKESLGLGKVDNTRDIDKPVSKSVQEALDEKVSKEELTEFAEYIERLKKRQGEIENGIQSLGGICANPIPIGGKVGDVLMKRSDLDGDFWWSKPASSENATEETTGVAKIATLEDAKQGTEDTKIMTPLKVKTVLSDEVLKLNSEIDANADAILKTRNDLQSEIDNNAGDISGLQAETTTLKNDLNGLGDKVSGIEEKIPSNASASNQLADKSFVNSSISSNTANFIGTFNSVAELEAYSGTLTNNDYAFVVSQDTAGNTVYNRYKWNGTEWLFEYALNNSSFTSDQWASINSMATASKISQIATNTSDISALQSRKQDNITGAATTITSSNLTANRALLSNSSGKVGVSSVTATELGYLSGATGAIQTQLNGKQATISDLETIRSGAEKGSTAVQPNQLSTVATSGSYNDLTNKPTIPTVNNGTLTIQKNGVQVATFSANQSENVTANIVADTQVNADWNATSGVAQILNKPTLSTVATSGSYNDLSNKPTIPTTPSQVGALPDTTKYASSLSYTEDRLQLKDQDGNALGNSVTIKASAGVDNKSITKNTSDELQTVGVIDQNDTVNAIKTWSGTRAEFEAIATKDPNTIYNVEDDFHKEGVVGFGRNVGDIFYTTRTDSELNGAVECNGATYNKNDFTGEQAIGNLLELNKLPYVSLSEYASLVSTNGSCRAFGWDGGDSFRVPTLQDVYIEAGTALTAGEFINESLPNISGTFNAVWEEARGRIATGAFGATNSGGSNESPNSPGSGQCTWDFNASRSSSAYQDGAKVKPDSVRYRAMVQLANEATDEALITATSALQQIANKVDKTSATDRALVSGWGMPSDKYIDLTLGASGSTYTAPANGWVYIAKGASTNQYISITIKTDSNTNLLEDYNVKADSVDTNLTMYFPIRKNQKFIVRYNATETTNFFRFIYPEGEV